MMPWLTRMLNCARRRAFVRAWVSFPLMFVFVFGSCPNALAEDRVNDESLLKAAFIFNFAQFTDWPESGGRGEPLSLCIAGTDALANALGRLGGKIVKDQVLLIQPIESVRSVKNCSMLYVASSEAATQSAWLKPISGQAVLSISELPGFAEKGGIFELYRDHARVRFMVNLAVARRAGLKISPNLLNLATIVGADNAANKGP